MGVVGSVAYYYGVEVMYDFSSITAAGDWAELFVAVNAESGSLLAVGVVVLLWLMLFGLFLRWGVGVSFAVANIVCAIVVSLLFALGVVPFLVLFLFWVAAAASFWLL